MRKRSRNQIRSMFNTIAGRYDLINRMVSFRRDASWRRTLIAALPDLANPRLLDLASGTGDVLLALIAARPGAAATVGADVSEAMLTAAAEKLKHAGLTRQGALVVSDAAALCFPNESFDVITIAFGIRNFTELDRSLQEMHRVLRSGGRILILEFSLPKKVVLRTVYLLYFRHVLPLIAGWISRQPEAYRYLNRSVEAFPYGAAFMDILTSAGFMPVGLFPLTFGVATLYVVEKER